MYSGNFDCGLFWMHEKDLVDSGFFYSIIAHAQFQKGEVIDSVYCSHDKSQSYALYLPSGYSPDKSWPGVYFFEPAARGRLPLDMYSLSLRNWVSFWCVLTIQEMEVGK